MVVRPVDRNWRKVLRTAVMLGLISVSAFLVAAGRASGEVKVVIDGRPLEADVPARLSGGRVLVPVRQAFTALGAEVAWDEAAQTVTATKGGTVVKLQVGQKVAYKDGRAVALDTAPVLAGWRVLVPLRFVGEAFGLVVAWDKATRTAYLESGAADLPVVGSFANLKRLLAEAQKYAGAFGVAKAEASVGAGGPALPQFVAKDAPVRAPAAHSTTNVQVEGVDEADVVKTDGKYIYQVNGSRVIVIEAYPPQSMRVAGVLKFADKDFVPQELYVDEKYLVVIGTSQPEGPIIMRDGPGVGVQIYPPPPQLRRYVKAIVYDVRDKAAMNKVREVEIEGDYVSSRKIGAALYLVANKGLDYYYIMEQNGREGILPAYRDSAGTGDYAEIPYSAIRYIPRSPEPAYLLVAGLNLDRPDEEMEVSAYLGAGQNVYASPQNLYVAVTRYEPLKEQPSGPAQKLLPPPPAATKTAVFKFALDGGHVRYKGRGEVPGTVLNQFSMDEYRGYFRLATTVGDAWRTDAYTSKNNVYVLDESMKVAGKLENLAPGERIYAVRFLGDRGYVVTFRTVDPLFVIDLQEPRAPKVLGALKIPGYSDYLHPYDANHIIGFGKDTIELPQKDRQGKETGTMAFYQGLKMALFDVSDVTHPIEKFKEVIGDRGTDSELLQNHKALLFSRDKNLLAFPVTVMEIRDKGEATTPEGMPRYGEFSFQGAYVYRIDLEEGFRLLARITHLDREDYEKAGRQWYDGDKNVERILYIGDTLYTLSRRLIKAHDLVSLKEQNVLVLP